MKRSYLPVALMLLLAAPTFAGPASDTDSDGVFDLIDFCVNEFLAPIPIGCDTDMDGFGNGCDGDLNNDGLVNGADFTSPTLPDFLDCFVAGSDPSGIGCDVNCDGLVNGSDFTSPAAPDFLDFFLSGQVGPSGLPCAGFTIPCP